jgi:hypothetical protein
MASLRRSLALAASVFIATVPSAVRAAINTTASKLADAATDALAGADSKQPIQATQLITRSRTKKGISEDYVCTSSTDPRHASYTKTVRSASHWKIISEFMTEFGKTMEFQLISGSDTRSVTYMPSSTQQMICNNTSGQCIKSALPIVSHDQLEKLSADVRRECLDIINHQKPQPRHSLLNDRTHDHPPEIFFPSLTPTH